MKKIMLIAVSLLLFTGCKQNNSASTEKNEATSTENTAPANNGRFDDKSGVLITETDMMGMGKSTLKMTFDDYGKKMLNEMTMMGKEIHSKSLIKDDYVYTWSDMNNMAMKIRIEDNIDDKTIDYKNMSEEMRKKLNFKEEGNETIDGKDCKVFSFSMEKEGMKGKSWVWKGLPLQSEMEMQGKKILTKFKQYETNISIPASTFDLPTGIEFKDMSTESTPTK